MTRASFFKAVIHSIPSWCIVNNSRSKKTRTSLVPVRHHLHVDRNKKGRICLYPLGKGVVYVCNTGSSRLLKFQGGSHPSSDNAENALMKSDHDASGQKGQSEKPPRKIGIKRRKFYGLPQNFMPTSTPVLQKRFLHTFFVFLL